MEKKEKPPLIFFNASAIIAGLISPTGGSAKLLRFVSQKRIIGAISEIVLDEVLKHVGKIGSTKQKVEEEIRAIFSLILPSPHRKIVDSFKNIVIDYGDAHVLASSEEAGCAFLVTLDEKHLIKIRNKVKRFQIVTPKQLFEYLSTKK